MYKLCKTEQSARRQQELEQALLAQMRIHHYDDISVSDLCDLLNIPRKAFYRYFSGKKGALFALMDHTISEFEQDFVGFSAMTKAQQLRVLEDFFRFWKEHRTMLDALNRSDLLDTLVGRTMAMAYHASKLPPDGDGLRWKSWKYITDFSVCGLMAVMMGWYRTGFEESEAVMASIAQGLMASATSCQSKNAD